MRRVGWSDRQIGSHGGLSGGINAGCDLIVRHEIHVGSFRKKVIDQCIEHVVLGAVLAVDRATHEIVVRAVQPEKWRERVTREHVVAVECGVARITPWIGQHEITRRRRVQIAERDVRIVETDNDALYRILNRGAHDLVIGCRCQGAIHRFV